MARCLTSLAQLSYADVMTYESYTLLAVAN